MLVSKYTRVACECPRCRIRNSSSLKILRVDPATIINDAPSIRKASAALEEHLLTTIDERHRTLNVEKVA